jgi:hypothetical protein
LHRGFYQCFDPGRPIGIDRLGSIEISGDRHQRAKTGRMIIMTVGDEDRTNLSDSDARFRKTADDAIAGVDDIECPVDDQQIR